MGSAGGDCGDHRAGCYGAQQLLVVGFVVGQVEAAVRDGTVRAYIGRDPDLHRLPVSDSSHTPAQKVAEWEGEWTRLGTLVSRAQRDFETTVEWPMPTWLGTPRRTVVAGIAALVCFATVATTLVQVRREAVWWMARNEVGARLSKAVISAAPACANVSRMFVRAPENELTDPEVQALEVWMSGSSQGGVLITGDHSNGRPLGADPGLNSLVNLGRALGHRVPRGGRLRVWEGLPSSDFTGNGKARLRLTTDTRNNPDFTVYAGTGGVIDIEWLQSGMAESRGHSVSESRFLDSRWKSNGSYSNASASAQGTITGTDIAGTVGFSSGYMGTSNQRYTFMSR